MVRLPSPLGVEQIRSPKLSASESFIKKGAIFGLIQRIRFIPNPFPIEHITTIPTLFKKPNFGVVIYKPIELLEPKKSLRLIRTFSFSHGSVIEVEEAED